jgi:hypothetical protein
MEHPKKLTDEKDELVHGVLSNLVVPTSLTAAAGLREIGNRSLYSLWRSLLVVSPVNTKTDAVVPTRKWTPSGTSVR